MFCNIFCSLIFYPTSSVSTRPREVLLIHIMGGWVLA